MFLIPFSVHTSNNLTFFFNINSFFKIKNHFCYLYIIVFGGSSPATFSSPRRPSTRCKDCPAKPLLSILMGSPPSCSSCSPLLAQDIWPLLHSWASFICSSWGNSIKTPSLEESDVKTKSGLCDVLAVCCRNLNLFPVPTFSC